MTGMFCMTNLIGQSRNIPAFPFLEWQGNAKYTALGNKHVSDQSNSFASAILINPALSSNQFQIDFTHSAFIASTNRQSLSISFPVKQHWNFGFNFRKVSFDRTFERDKEANIIGEIQPRQNAFTANVSRTEGNFKIGFNLSWIANNLDGYRQFGFVGSLGAVYTDTSKQFQFGTVIKHFGVQYDDLSSSTLQPEIAIGISKKPEYVPVTLFASIHSLTQFEQLYFDPEAPRNDVVGFGENETNSSEPSFFLQAMGHFVLGAELNIAERFQFRLSYDYLQRQFQELANEIAGSGFAFGFGISPKHWGIHYAWQPIRGIGNSHTISLSLRPSKYLTPVIKKFMQ